MMPHIERSRALEHATKVLESVQSPIRNMWTYEAKEHPTCAIWLDNGCEEEGVIQPLAHIIQDHKKKDGNLNRLEIEVFPTHVRISRVTKTGVERTEYPNGTSANVALIEHEAWLMSEEE